MSRPSFFVQHANLVFQIFYFDCEQIDHHFLFEKQIGVPVSLILFFFFLHSIFFRKKLDEKPPNAHIETRQVKSDSAGKSSFRKDRLAPGKGRGAEHWGFCSENLLDDT